MVSLVRLDEFSAFWLRIRIRDSQRLPFLGNSLNSMMVECATSVSSYCLYKPLS